MAKWAKFVPTQVQPIFRGMTPLSLSLSLSCTYYYYYYYYPRLRHICLHLISSTPCSTPSRWSISGQGGSKHELVCLATFFGRFSLYRTGTTPSEARNGGVCARPAVRGGSAAAALSTGARRRRAGVHSERHRWLRALRRAQGTSRRTDVRAMEQNSPRKVSSRSRERRTARLSTPGPSGGRTPHRAVYAVFAVSAS